MIEYAFDAEEGKAVMKRTNEVSKLVGVSRRTLQYYDDEGLLGAKRSELNYRLYDQQALERIWRIMIFKEMGFELAEPSGQGRWLIMCPYWLDMCPCKKSLKVQEKSFQACVCLFECNRVEKRTKFRKLEPPDTNLATVPVTNGIWQMAYLTLLRHTDILIMKEGDLFVN